MSRSKYEIPEPLSVRLRLWWAVRVTCPRKGHDWKHKMHDDVCARCRTSRPRRGLSRRVTMIATEYRWPESDRR